MNLLDSITGFLGKRIDHVPAADVPTFLETLNSLSNPTGNPAARVFTETDLRNFETTQTLYVTHRLLKAAVPHNTPQALVQAVQAAEGVLDQGLVAQNHANLPAPEPVAQLAPPVQIQAAGLGG
jgi:hypothetical protein